MDTVQGNSDHKCVTLPSRYHGDRENLPCRKDNMKNITTTTTDNDKDDDTNTPPRHTTTTTDVLYVCTVYTERAETAAVSRDTNHITTKQRCKYITSDDIQNAF